MDFFWFRKNYVDLARNLLFSRAIPLFKLMLVMRQSSGRWPIKYGSKWNDERHVPSSKHRCLRNPDSVDRISRIFTSTIRKKIFSDGFVILLIFKWLVQYFFSIVFNLIRCTFILEMKIEYYFIFKKKRSYRFFRFSIARHKGQLLSLRYQNTS